MRLASPPSVTPSISSHSFASSLGICCSSASTWECVGKVWRTRESFEEGESHCEQASPLWHPLRFSAAAHQLKVVNSGNKMLQGQERVAARWPQSCVITGKVARFPKHVPASFCSGLLSPSPHLVQPSFCPNFAPKFKAGSLPSLCLAFSGPLTFAETTTTSQPSVMAFLRSACKQPEQARQGWVPQP